MQETLLLLFGVAVGILSGMMGIGGGVVLVPGLILLFGFSQAEAQGTSLAVMIPPIGIFAAMIYYQHGYVRLPVVGLIAAGFIAGAFLGAKLTPYVPIELLRGLTGILLLYVGFLFLFNPRGEISRAALPAGLAATLASVAALLLRRRRPPARRLPPPTDGIDYHI